MPTRTLPDMAELLARLVAIEEAAVEASDAVPYSFQQQEGFPYWTNRAGRMVFERDSSEELVTMTITITATLYVGHAEADYHGQLDNQLASQFMLVTDDLNRSARAQSGLYPGPMGYLEFLFVSEVSGVEIRQNRDGQGVFCTEFSIDCNFRYPQRYNYA